MDFKKYLILLIFILGFVLRFYRLSGYPHSLHRDELAIGYNAYSLLKTQKGEHGEGPWPMNFLSFGDYKMPGLIYLTVPFIRLFGLNNFSIRLPNAIMGSLTVILSYLVLLKIFPKKRSIALFGSLFLAVAPYHIHAARMVYEPQVAFTWQLLGLFILLSYKERMIKLLSLLFFLAAMFTYNSPVFLILPLCLVLIYCYRRDFFSKKSRPTTIFFLFGLLVVYGVYFFVFRDINSQKSQTTILTKQDYIEEINGNIDFAHKKRFTPKNCPDFF